MALEAAPDFKASRTDPGVAGRLEHAPHEGHRRIEVVGRRIDQGHREHDVRVVGPVDTLVLLGDDHPVLHAHRVTRSRTPANRSRSPSSDGIDPTSERARIQSSHG